jgi:protocatechuate 3,4-dioxygenase beta subunit
MRRYWLSLPVALVLLSLANIAAAQDKKHETQLRTVRGTVIDRDENPIPAGVIYLKNLKSLAVKTYIADDTGHYRFSGLDPNVDYEVHAEHHNLTSAKHTISSLDNRKEIVITLKVDKEKKQK